MSDFESWQHLLDSVTKTASRKGKLDAFSAVRNDNTRRIQLLLQDDFTRNILIDWIDKVLDLPERLLSVSKSHREEGNHLFLSQNYRSCLAAYTQSIKTCPEASSEELSIVYANRSAALFHLGLYNESLADMNVALSLGYPNHLLHKLLLRKLKCLKFLGSKDQVQTVFQELTDAVQLLKLADQKKMEKEIAGLQKLLPVKKNHRESGNKSLVVPELFHGPSPNIAGASSALEIRHSEIEGRFIVTNTDVRAGDTLFAETPSALVVLPDFQDSRCHHCTRALLHPHPCLRCGSTWFCSEECCLQAESYHAVECGLLPLLHSIGIAHLGFRIVVSVGLEGLLRFRSALEKETAPRVPGVESSYIERGYDILYHLVSHTEAMLPEELYQYALTAALLTLVMERRTAFLDDAKESTRHAVGGHMLRHICQMVCNAHAITELCVVDDSGGVSSERQERIATAIYPSASLMNHSCDPTVINSFEGNQLIVRAIKDVPTDGQVFNCYGPHFRRMPRAERQESLSAQYSFTCRCSVCLDPHSEDFQDVIHSFRCPVCHGPLVSPKTGRLSASSAEDQTTLCRSCIQKRDYFPQLRSDLEAMSLDARGTAAMEVGDMTQALKHLSKCVQLRRSALYKAHPDLGRSADKLAQCHAFLGQYDECAGALRTALTAVDEQFGRFSIEKAHELQKYTDVLLELVETRPDPRLADDLRRHLEEARSIYRIHYGSWSKSHEEIDRKWARTQRLTSTHSHVY